MSLLHHKTHDLTPAPYRRVAGKDKPVNSLMCSLPQVILENVKRKCIWLKEEGLFFFPEARELSKAQVSK